MPTKKENFTESQKYHTTTQCKCQHSQEDI